MDIFKIYFSKIIFMFSALLIIAIFFYTIFRIYREYTNFNSDIAINVFLLFISLFFVGIFLIAKKRSPSKNIIFFIIAINLIFKIIILFVLQTKPIADFAVIYDSAKLLSEGNTSVFEQSSYIMRFPHFIGLMLYYTIIHIVSPFPQITILISNALFSIFSIFVFYKIAKEIFNSDEVAATGVFIYSMFIPTIMYPLVFCSENIAIPFYLLSLYFFILWTKNYKYSSLIASGIFLSFASFFRMVGYVVLTAYIIYILLYLSQKYFIKIKYTILLLVCAVIPIVLISYSLKFSGLSKYHVWQAGEPFLTSVLKGTNIESLGSWNQEDAMIVEKNNHDYDKIIEECKKIIIERLTNTPFNVLAEFYFKKFASQWSSGDFAGCYWAQMSIDETKIDLVRYTYLFVKIWFLMILILVIKGLFENRNNYMFLLNILFIGFVLFYLIIENQERYAYIINWFFILAALNGINVKSNKNDFISLIL